MSEPLMEMTAIGGAPRKLEGTELVTENQKQRSKLWILTPDRQYIFFREVSLTFIPHRPLRPSLHCSQLDVNLLPLTDGEAATTHTRARFVEAIFVVCC